MTVDRRSILKGMAALGGLMAARPFRALASPLGGLVATGASRASLLEPGLFVIHTDLHNHTWVSGDTYRDGAGTRPSPEAAYAQMRAKGLDAVSLTEHAISGKYYGAVVCANHDLPCRIITGFNITDWPAIRAVSDAHNVDGEFVSVTGFEWSTPTVGHVNVWYSEQFTDSFSERAFITPTAIAEADRIGFPSEIANRFEDAPELATMDGFHDWISSPPDRPGLGGGADGIGCFNHPNEFGDFEAFAYHPGAAQRIVSIEALNMNRDFYWFSEKGRPNPLDACLNAGWRVGFTGVSDEHGEPYGRDGRARGGLWVDVLTRAGVRRALEARRSFATFEPGLRLDARIGAVPMGGVLPYDGAPLSVDLDIDAGPEYARTLVVSAITSGPVMTPVAEVTLPTAGPVSITVPSVDGRWMFLRITDPDRPTTPLAPDGVVAYASAFFLER